MSSVDTKSMVVSLETRLKEWFKWQPSSPFPFAEISAVCQSSSIFLNVHSVSETFWYFSSILSADYWLLCVFCYIWLFYSSSRTAQVMNTETQTAEPAFNHIDDRGRLCCLHAKWYNYSPEFSAFHGKKIMPGTEKQYKKYGNLEM